MRSKIAGLEVQVFQATTTPPTAAVILCHGFGAPGGDLVGLGPELARTSPALRDVRFYFPAAPLSLGDGGWGDSRAWWMIDMVAIQKLQNADEAAWRDFRKLEPQGMPAARKALLAVVAEVANHTRLPMKRIALGGFSQGAMLATDVSLRLEEAPAALAVLSGTVLLEDTWKTKAAGRAGLPVFQSHGRQDPVLPFRAAERLHALLTEAKLRADFHPFSGGHTIPPEVLGLLATFLSKELAR